MRCSDPRSTEPRLLGVSRSVRAYTPIFPQQSPSLPPSKGTLLRSGVVQIGNLRFPTGRSQNRKVWRLTPNPVEIDPGQHPHPDVDLLPTQIGHLVLLPPVALITRLPSGSDMGATAMPTTFVQEQKEVNKAKQKTSRVSITPDTEQSTPLHITHYTVTRNTSRSQNSPKI